MDTRLDAQLPAKLNETLLSAAIAHDDKMRLRLTQGWRSGAHLVDARIGLQDMPFQNYPNQRMDLTDNRAERFNLHYRGEFEGLTLDARSWHEDVAHAMDFGADKRYWYGMASNVPASMSEGRPCSPISYTCAAGMPMLTDSRNNGGKLAAEFALGGKDLVRVGGEIHAYRLHDYWPPSGRGMPTLATTSRRS